MKEVRMLFVALCIGLTARAAGVEAPAVLMNKQVRVEAQIVAGQLSERYLARSGDAWIPVATDSASAGPVELAGAEGPVPVRAVKVAAEGGALVEELVDGDARVVRTLQFVPGGPWIHITTRLALAAALQLHSLADRFAFACGAG